MERPRIAICNLSRLKFVEHGDLEMRTLEQEREYEFRDSAGVFLYKGIQTNQAPVKCILDRALYEDHIPVTLLINLYSPECETEHAPYVNELGEEDRRTDECYFVDSIVEYCENSGIPCPDFERIPYDMDNPANSLDELIGLLNMPGAIVDIDTTGGLRDAATLITLAMQTIQSKPAGLSNGIKTGRIVYSNLQSEKIFLQTNSYDLVDLSGAITAFTSYGKADQLRECFMDDRASEPIRRLCDELKVFSEKLSLCNTELKGSVNRIHDLLNTIERIPSTELSSSEMLFATLIPRFRQGFVKNDEHLTLHLIRWCVDRQMIPQALALIREQIPGYIVSRGLITVYNGAQSRDIEQISLGCNIEKRYDAPILDETRLDKATTRAKNALKCMLHPSSVVDRTYADVPSKNDARLAEALIWFRYLWYVRNTIMHANSEKDFYSYKRFSRFLSGEYGERSYLRVNKNGTGFVPQAQTMQNMVSDLEMAMHAFEQLR